jgi:hypothetical protein
MFKKSHLLALGLSILGSTLAHTSQSGCINDECTKDFNGYSACLSVPTQSASDKRLEEVSTHKLHNGVYVSMVGPQNLNHLNIVRVEEDDDHRHTDFGVRIAAGKPLTCDELFSEDFGVQRLRTLNSVRLNLNKEILMHPRQMMTYEREDKPTATIFSEQGATIYLSGVTYYGKDNSRQLYSAIHARLNVGISFNPLSHVHMLLAIRSLSYDEKIGAPVADLAFDRVVIDGVDFPADKLFTFTPFKIR